MSIAEDNVLNTYLRKLGSFDLSLTDSLPDFLVISPGKTGTTWLYQNLCCHDEIYIPGKELNYFNINWKIVDINWYTKLFQNKSNFIKGDVSPGYTILPTQVIRIIKQLMPDLKLIFLMRDPVDRAWSHVKYSIKYHDLNFASYRGDFDNVPEQRISEHFSAPNLFAYNDYLGILKRWMTAFPKEQFYVGFYESIKNDPQRLLTEIFAHLGMKQDLDWKRFKTSERIFAGNKREIPEAYKQFLRFIWKERTEELIAFLKDEFNIHDIPGEWNVTLAAQDAEAVVVEKDFKGFGIVQYRDKLYGISAETLNNNSEIPLIDKICSSAAEGENIYQVKKHIARLERAYIWSEFDHDPVLMRIADDIELLADNRYCDIFEKVINDDYLLHILDSHNLMREIFLESDYKGFNIIHFRNKLYALSRDLGAVRLADVDYSEIETWQKNKMCFIGETFRDIESLINGSDIDDWLDTIIDQLNRLVQHEEALFGNGEAGKAYINLSVILQRINQIRGTIINDMAVIHTQEWELDEAERLLVSLMQEGSDCENAARNLEIVRNIKRGFYPQADNVTEQSPLITEAKGVTE